MKNKITLVRAVIIHTRPYRDTSLLVDAFTQKHGKISLVAKGARNSKRGWRQALNPFNEVLLSYVGKHELVTLTEVEVVRPFMLKGELLYCGLYLNELLMKLLHKGEPFGALYHQYLQTLEGLAHGRAPQELLRYFEIQLLEDLGYGINLRQEANTQQSIEKQAYYRFLPDAGFVFLSNEKPIDCNFHVFKGECLMTLQERQPLPIEFLRDAKRLMRLALLPLLGSKSMKTRELFLVNHDE